MSDSGGATMLFYNSVYYVTPQQSGKTLVHQRVQDQSKEQTMGEQVRNTNLSLNAYQRAASETAVYPDAGEGNINALSYVTLGLVGEAGEIANKVKKVIRDSDGVMSATTRADIRKEVGDVLWYVARLADELGVPLGYIADANLGKLYDRKDRGVLGGSGDER